MSNFLSHVNCSCDECAACPCSWGELVFGHNCGPKPVAVLNREAVEHALRQVMADIDYDIHKEIECNEDGEDDYPRYVDKFVAEYNKAAE